VTRPRSKRHRVNAKVTPRTGGIAIALAFAVPVLCFSHLTPELKGILIGGAIVFVGMLLDDMFDIPAVLKLLIQSIAAIVVISFGVRVTALTDFLHGGFFVAGSIWHFADLHLDRRDYQCRQSHRRAGRPCRGAWLR